MKQKKSSLINLFLVAGILLANSCSRANTANVLSPQTVLVGSTPGDSLIRSLLTINPDKPVDFIRWDLTLDQSENDPSGFVLNINFGEGQPNTPWFKGGGEKLSFKGVYTITKSPQGNIYELKCEKPQIAILMVKLNDNLFHLLTPDNKLMVGNGGWSYTLNRKDFSANSSKVLPLWTTSLPNDTSQKVIFDGRTPCLDFPQQYNLQSGNNCLKLKWKITFFRDAETNNPTTYTLESTLNRAKAIEGKWTIIKGIKNNSEAIIYQLDLDKPNESISFLVGDENVLFFLDKENQLFTGNGDFSFTLNRRK